MSVHWITLNISRSLRLSGTKRNFWHSLHSLKWCPSVWTKTISFSLQVLPKRKDIFWWTGWLKKLLCLRINVVPEISWYLCLNEHCIVRSFLRKRRYMFRWEDTEHLSCSQIAVTFPGNYVRTSENALLPGPGPCNQDRIQTLEFDAKWPK